MEWWPLVLSVALLLPSVIHCRDEYTEDGIFIRSMENLSEVPTDIPAEAKQISLQDNRITEIRTESFLQNSRCTKLFVNDNMLTTIEAGAFLGLSKLKLLWLYNNKLAEIRADMWSGLSSLKQLSIGTNKIKSLPTNAFLGLSQLKKLTVGYNDLTVISGEMFKGLNSLEELHLYGNEISVIEPGTFIHLPNLDWLLLNYNQLATLNGDAFVYLAEGVDCPAVHPTDMFLALEYNPMECDSRLCWLQEAEREGWIELSYIYRSPINCVNYPGVNWQDVTLNCTES